MDAEPIRCRRTDGKKWRCRLPVIPDQKYCERHVHRGRLCSRKPVEVNGTFLNSKSKSKTGSTTTTSISSLKTTPNLQSATKTNHNKVVIKNQSFKIKKHSRENACGPLEFTFSPKSVLQHGNVLSCGTSSNNHKIGQVERCRRTDGKKWRCRKDVLPGLKYCVQHMHRGVKKVENGQKLNPGLSFSVGASYQQMDDNGNRSHDSSSSSEATTISM